jgi:hypothetical protein
MLSAYKMHSKNSAISYCLLFKEISVVYFHGNV